MERTSVENLKEMIRAGRGKIPADKVIKGGQLVNVMSSEIYPADIAIYKDMIAAVGDVEDYVGPETEIIDAKGKYLTPGMIDGHIHSECSKLSITSYAKSGCSKRNDKYDLRVGRIYFRIRSGRLERSAGRSEEESTESVLGSALQDSIYNSSVNCCI